MESWVKKHTQLSYLSNWDNIFKIGQRPTQPSYFKESGQDLQNSERTSLDLVILANWANIWKARSKNPLDLVI